MPVQLVNGSHDPRICAMSRLSTEYLLGPGGTDREITRAVQRGDEVPAGRTQKVTDVDCSVDQVLHWVVSQVGEGAGTQADGGKCHHSISRQTPALPAHTQQVSLR